MKPAACERPPERFASERLQLRRVLPSDAAGIFRTWAQDPEVTRFLLWKPHASQADTEAFLELCQAGWRAGDSLAWVLELDGRLAGMLAGDFQPPDVEVGYVLARPFWGRGLMSEALRALCAQVWLLPAFTRLNAFCHRQHRPSARVLQKAGFRSRGVWPRHCVFPNLGAEPCDCEGFILERDAAWTTALPT